MCGVYNKRLVLQHLLVDKSDDVEKHVEEVKMTFREDLQVLLQVSESMSVANPHREAETGNE